MKITGIINSLKNEEFAVFCGAGISRDSGMLSAVDVKKYILNESNYPDKKFTNSEVENSLNRNTTDSIYINPLFLRSFSIDSLMSLPNSIASSSVILLSDTSALNSKCLSLRDCQFTCKPLISCANSSGILTTNSAIFDN
jgi:hypothetical protein